MKLKAINSNLHINNDSNQQLHYNNKPNIIVDNLVDFNQLRFNN